MNEWQGIPKYSEEACCGALCPPQIPSSNLHRRNEKPATNSLSYGTA
jgi:hypothetical protein